MQINSSIGGVSVMATLAKRVEYDPANPIMRPSSHVHKCTECRAEKVCSSPECAGIVEARCEGWCVRPRVRQ